MEFLNHTAHVVLGFGAALAAVIALAAGKGSRWHRWSGWAFAAGMLVAALTTFGFMPEDFRPLAVIQACTAIYALGTAILALNPHWPSARMGEWALFVFLLLIMLGIVATGVILWRSGGGIAPGPVAFFAILAFFAALDVRYLRRAKVPHPDRLRRHALRMAMVVSETVRAPLLTFADDLSIPFPVIVFGTFLLVPLIYVAFTPAILRGNYTLKESPLNRPAVP